MKTIGIVPARGGSKRVPRKNMRLLGGKPLVRWAIDAATASRRLDLVVVTSDDEEILRVARENPCCHTLLRPKEISDDQSEAIEYVKHALGAVEGEGGVVFGVVAIVQPSSPLTLAEDIDGTVELLLASGADSAVSVVRVPHDVNPVKFKVLRGTRLLPYLEEEAGRMSSHRLPEVYVRNCSVYATRREVIESGRIIGEDCRGYVMPRDRSVDINEEFDLQLAEFLVGRRACG